MPATDRDTTVSFAFISIHVGQDLLPSRAVVGHGVHEQRQAAIGENMIRKAESRAQRSIERVALKDIALDPENPRLGTDERLSEPQMLAYLHEEESLDELAVSLVRNGYFDEEPIVLVPDKRPKGKKWIVVEGNRRVATLMLLQDPSLRKAVGVSGWPRASNDQLAALAYVPSVIYESRPSVLPYLGFRHITGVRTWGNYAKARYVAQLIEAGQKVDSIEESIGDSAQQVRKLYQSYVVYQQYRAEFGDHKRMRRSFSLLEVALGQAAIKDFIGIPRSLPDRPTKTLVPRSKLKNFEELVGWIFGDAKTGEGRILTDSRAIHQKLAKVVANAESLKHLREEGNLEEAAEYTDGELRYLLTQLRRAENSTSRALGLLPLHKGEPEVSEAVTRLAKLVQSLTRGVA